MLFYKRGIILEEMNKYLLVMLIALIIALIGGIVYISSMNKQPALKSFGDFTPQVFSTELGTGGYALIDVRTADEFKAGHIVNAKQANFNNPQEFSKYLSTLDKNGKYLIYCRTGVRSAKAMQEMQDKDFTNVHDLVGGYAAWANAGLPTE
jgi:rhodanese-related sulfurtransferase